MRAKQSLDDILGDFDAVEPEERHKLKRGYPISIWVPVEYKARYDQLQSVSKQQFSKKVREALLALIELAEKRAS
jgi:hypothetical protein